MDDLISRQAAIDEMNEWIWDPAYQHDVVASLRAMPSAQPERNKGRWYDVGSLSCRCSECGCKSPKEYSFCPNCGADMRGEGC